MECGDLAKLGDQWWYIFFIHFTVQLYTRSPTLCLSLENAKERRDLHQENSCLLAFNLLYLPFSLLPILDMWEKMAISARNTE